MFGDSYNVLCFRDRSNQVASRTWREEEELELRQLFDQFRESNGRCFSHTQFSRSQQQMTHAFALHSYVIIRNHSDSLSSPVTCSAVVKLLLLVCSSVEISLNLQTNSLRVIIVKSWSKWAIVFCYFALAFEVMKNWEKLIGKAKIKLNDWAYLFNFS